MTPQEKRNHIARVRSRLARRPRWVEYAHISDATGVSVVWIKAFARSKYENPDFHKVLLVDTYLSGIK